ncbi:hypothetical protein LINPERPRIM_LOCUS11394, partial [Linum perenne]
MCLRSFLRSSLAFLILMLMSLVSGMMRMLEMHFWMHWIRLMKLLLLKANSLQSFRVHGDSRQLLYYVIVLY